MTDRIPIHEGRKLLQAQATHKEIMSAVTEYLDAHRIPYAVTDAAEAFNRKGQRIQRVTPDWPDVTACLPPGGVAFPIEVKTAKDRLRPGQARMLHALYMAGALVCVARSLDDLVATLKAGKATAETLAEIAETLTKEGSGCDRWRASKGR